jgi:hypothetical protein
LWNVFCSFKDAKVAQLPVQEVFDMRTIFTVVIAGAMLASCQTTRVAQVNVYDDAYYVPGQELVGVTAHQERNRPEESSYSQNGYGSSYADRFRNFGTGTYRSPGMGYYPGFGMSPYMGWGGMGYSPYGPYGYGYGSWNQPWGWNQPWMNPWYMHDPWWNHRYRPGQFPPQHYKPQQEPTNRLRMRTPNQTLPTGPGGDNRVNQPQRQAPGQVPSTNPSRPAPNPRNQMPTPDQPTPQQRAPQRPAPGGNNNPPPAPQPGNIRPAAPAAAPSSNWNTAPAPRMSAPSSSPAPSMSTPSAPRSSGAQGGSGGGRRP